MKYVYLHAVYKLTNIIQDIIIFYLSHVIVQLLYIPPAAGASRPLTVE